MAHPTIEEKLTLLPAAPGCYLMKDDSGTVIYVGKAAVLRERVRSYFRSPDQLSLKNRSMVPRIVDLEWITVNSELEALLTENQLIKQYRPKYNVLLKDDKTFPYIKITNEPFPRIERTRRVVKDGGRYFGPYASSQALNITMDLLKKLFPYRSCRLKIVPQRVSTPSAAQPERASALPSPSAANHYLARVAADGGAVDTVASPANRACLEYYIHRCVAPCIGAASVAEYGEVIRQVTLFLEGKHDEVLTILDTQMTAAALDEHYERAAVLRDQIRAVQRISERQRVSVPGGKDQDVIGMARVDNDMAVHVFHVRQGSVIGRDAFFMQGVADTEDDAVLRAFLMQYYDTVTDIPPEILVPHAAENHSDVIDWLARARGRRVALDIPQIGDKRRLVEMAAKNAEGSAAERRLKWLNDEQKTTGALQELRVALNLPHLPLRIECYDIATIQGTSTVGAMVVFEQGKPRTAAYRRFHIKTTSRPGEPNDFASMSEMLRRRFKRAQGWQATSTPDEESGEMSESDREWAARPDLIIIDGGKGQLGVVLQAMSDLHVVDVPVVGLAKENEELFLPNLPQPIILPRSSQALFLVQRVRDETHRFANTFHRDVRSKRALVSDLDSVPGVGGKRKRALIQRFGSVAELRRASEDEIAAVDGIGPRLASTIKHHLGGV